MNAIPSSKIDVIRRYVAEGFVIAAAVVVFDKPGNLPLKLIRRFPHDQAYPFLAGSVIPLDLPVGLRVIGRSQDMSDPFDGSSPAVAGEDPSGRKILQVFRIHPSDDDRWARWL